jgi:hypothetical protein
MHKNITKMILSTIAYIFKSPKIMMGIVIIALLGTIGVMRKLSANREKELLSQVDLATLKINNLTTSVEYYTNENGELITKAKTLTIEKKQFLNELESKDSILNKLRIELESMDVNLNEGTSVIVANNTTSIDTNGVAQIIKKDTIQMDSIRPIQIYDRLIAYKDPYNMVNVYIDSKTWNWNLDLIIKNELYIVNQSADKIKHKWMFIGINWNIFGFGKRVSNIHIKDKNPKSKIDDIFSVTLQ